MKSISQNEVDYSAKLKTPLTASGISLQHKQWQNEMTEKVTEMVDAHMRQVEKTMYEALNQGTSVLYADREQTDDNHLYVCGDTSCNGLKPSASDPLAYYRCKLIDAHCRIKACDVRKCYKPQVIDEHIAQEVKRLYGSKAYDQMWGLDDDPEEWTET
jgi:hypothetical protein